MTAKGWVTVFSLGKQFDLKHYGCGQITEVIRNCAHTSCKSMRWSKYTVRHETLYTHLAWPQIKSQTSVQVKVKINSMFKQSEFWSVTYFSIYFDFDLFKCLWNTTKPKEKMFTAFFFMPGSIHQKQQMKTQQNVKLSAVFKVSDNSRVNQKTKVQVVWGNGHLNPNNNGNGQHAHVIRQVSCLQKNFPSFPCDWAAWPATSEPPDQQTAGCSSDSISVPLDFVLGEEEERERRRERGQDVGGVCQFLLSSSACYTVSMHEDKGKTKGFGLIATYGTVPRLGFGHSPSSCIHRIPDDRDDVWQIRTIIV